MYHFITIHLICKAPFRHLAQRASYRHKKRIFRSDSEDPLEAPPRFELGMRVLQTLALPLGYSAVFVPDIFYAQRPVLIPTEEKIWSGLRGSNSLPPPWQGGALPDELSPRNKKYYSKTSPFCQAFFTFFSIVFSMSFKEPITAPVLLKMPPTAPQTPALLDTPEFLPPWA